MKRSKTRVAQSVTSPEKQPQKHTPDVARVSKLQELPPRFPFVAPSENRKKKPHD